jgi:hypothetical protein
MLVWNNFLPVDWPRASRAAFFERSGKTPFEIVMRSLLTDHHPWLSFRPK